MPVRQLPVRGIGELPASMGAVEIHQRVPGNIARTAWWWTVPEVAVAPLSVVSEHGFRLAG